MKGVLVQRVIWRSASFSRQNIAEIGQVVACDLWAVFTMLCRMHAVWFAGTERQREKKASQMTNNYNKF